MLNQALNEWGKKQYTRPSLLTEEAKNDIRNQRAAGEKVNDIREAHNLSHGGYQTVKKEFESRDEWNVKENGQEGCTVYFMQEDNDNRIKIGSSTNPEQRMVTIATSVPGKLTILATTEGGEEMESQLHEQFSEYQIGDSEWFEPAPKLIKFIADLNSQPANNSSQISSESSQSFGYLLSAVARAVSVHGIDTVKTAVKDLD